MAAALTAWTSISKIRATNHRGRAEATGEAVDHTRGRERAVVGHDLAGPGSASGEPCPRRRPLCGMHHLPRRARRGAPRAECTALGATGPILHRPPVGEL